MQTKTMRFLIGFIAMVFIGSSLLLADDSMSDHQAEIFDFKGSVKILKKSSTDWMDVQKGMILEVGDQLITSKESYLEIAYDKKFLNIARIEENTKAEFRSIEPTDLFLEDGTIFNALDGLKGEYQVSTPTAIAAVRGTHFEVIYDQATKNMDTAVLPDTKEHVSAVEITPMFENGDKGNPVFVQEGQQIDFSLEQLNSGGPLQPEAVDPSRVEKNNTVLNEMLEGAGPQLDKDDDDKNIGGGNPPNDGNNQNGGSNGTSSDSSALQPNLLSTGMPVDFSKTGDLGGKSFKADVDQLVDGLIPREDVPLDTGSPLPELGPKERDMSDSNSASGDKEKPEDVKPDLGQVMQFLATGGAFSEKDGSGNFEAPKLGAFEPIFEHWGFTPQQAETMTEFFAPDPNRFEHDPLPFNPNINSPGMDPSNHPDTFPVMPPPGGEFFSGNPCDLGLCGSLDPLQPINPNDFIPNPNDLITSTTLSPLQIFLSGGYAYDIWQLLSRDDLSQPGTLTYLQLAFASTGYTGSTTGNASFDSNYSLSITNLNSTNGTHANANYQLTNPGNSTNISGTVDCTLSNCTKTS